MAFKHKETLIIENRTIIRVIALVVASYLFLQFLGREIHVITLLLTAAFLAMALNPAVSWLSRRFGIKRRVRATAAAYLIVLFVLIGFTSLVVPPLASETVDFVKTLPDTIESFETQDSVLARFVRKYELDDQLSDISSNIRENTANYSRPVLSTAGRIGSTLLSAITVMVLAFMMLVEGPAWYKKFWALQPAKHRARNQAVAARMYRVITKYINGQVLIAAIAAGFALVALLIAGAIFNVSVNAIALSGIVFLFGLIPLIGNTLAAAVVVLICLFSSLGLAIAMAVFFLVYQQVENVSLQPYIQAKNNEMTPLLVFIAAIVGGSFGGLFGAFIAIPSAACLKILLEEYIARRGETEVASLQEN